MKAAGRKAVAGNIKRGIRNRLRQVMEEKHGKPLKWKSGFYAEYNVERKTAEGWLRSLDPVTPDVPALLRIAEQTGVNLDWLLRGSNGPHEVSAQALAARQFHGAVWNRLEVLARAKPRDLPKQLRSIHGHLVAPYSKRAVEALQFVREIPPGTLWEGVVCETARNFRDGGREFTRDRYGLPLTWKERLEREGG